jgi:hypothetical protein
MPGNHSHGAEHTNCRIERLIPACRQVHNVATCKFNRDVGSICFAPSDFQHVFRKIDADHLMTRLGQLNRQSAGATTQVQRSARAVQSAHHELRVGFQ